MFLRGGLGDLLAQGAPHHLFPEAPTAKACAHGVALERLGFCPSDGLSQTSLDFLLLLCASRLCDGTQTWSMWEPEERKWGTGGWGCWLCSQAWEADGGLSPSPRLHARFYELAPNLVPMDYRKSPIVHVPMSLIIQMPELRVWGP